jgi:hypothetical protein
VKSIWQTFFFPGAIGKNLKTSFFQLLILISPKKKIVRFLNCSLRDIPYSTFSSAKGEHFFEMPQKQAFHY